MKVQVFPYLGGERGTERTIAHMRKLVEAGKTNPVVVLQAHRIVRGIDRNQQARMAAKIFDYVQKNISYVRDPVGVEFVKDPAITLKTKTGDCDDQSVLFSALAESVGIETQFRAVKADPRSPGEFSHVYARAKIPGKGWMAADTIVPHAKFGWEVSGYPSRTWGGESGMGFIDAVNGGSLGDAQLAAGSVGYPDDSDDDSAFGSPFDGEESGGMYDTLPVLGEDTEEISTIVDTPDDFWHWGGSTDLGPGPGLKSRMLPMGVGAMNGIRTEVRGGVLGYYDGMGRWRPFRDIRRAVKSVGKGFKKIGENIAAGVKKVGEKIADKIGLSTPESRMQASINACNQALQPAWDSAGVQLALELLRRAEDIVNAQKEGRVPEYIKGPPPATLSGLVGELSQIDWKAIGTEVLNTGPLAPYTQALNLIKGLGAAEDQKAAERSLQSFVENFPQQSLNTAIENVTKLYVAAGGMLPSPGDKPPDAWKSQFIASAQKQSSHPQGGSSGWYYWYLIHLLKRLEAIQEPLKAATQVLKVAYEAHNKVAGKQTIETSAQVVKKAVETGSVGADEVAKALEVTKKVAQGYALTPEEQQLAAKIVDGAQAKGPGLAKYLLPVAAAAGGAALLL